MVLGVEVDVEVSPAVRGGNTFRNPNQRNDKLVILDEWNSKYDLIID